MTKIYRSRCVPLSAWKKNGDSYELDREIKEKMFEELCHDIAVRFLDDIPLRVEFSIEEEGWEWNIVAKVEAGNK